MKIGIDCRMYGLKHAGIGRYVENLVEELLKIDSANEYVIFVQKDFSTQNSKLKTITTNVPHYSIKEQLLMPGIIAKEKVDLMHFPHFNVPVFYRGKYVVTIHDLIKHSSRGAATTTRSSWLYWLKYLGYRFVFTRAVKKAEKIITPSKFVKDEIIKEYGVNPDKIVVAYEGVDNKLKGAKSITGIKGIAGILEKYEIKKPFLLYVGSVYPHKNIERLIEAVKILNQLLTTNHQPPTTLVVVCARNVFSERLHNKIVQMGAQDFVNFAGFVPDNDLSILYKEAEAFVFPTLSEGFGLPGLEAMSAGCPVACSDIAVLKEIYGDAAIYFDPLNTEQMAKRILEIICDRGRRNGLVEKGKKQVEKYSWSKMASEILKVYSSL